MLLKTIICIQLLIAAYSIATSENYFTYSDCDTLCVTQNISCLISLEQDTFIRRCTPSAEACAAQCDETPV